MGSPSTSPTKSKSPSTSFAPSTSPPTDFPTIGCADDEFGVMVRIITDYWANVDFNYWTITDMRGIEVWRVENHESNKMYDPVRKCLTKAPYTFTVHDGYGDGIPVNPVSDSFNVFVDGVKEIQGQTFTYKFEEKFAEEYTVPTITPTISSTDQSTDSPTISPTQTITDCEDSDKVHVKVEITTNSNPLETKWLIKSTGSYEDIVMSSPIYTTNYTEYSSMKCLDIDEKFLFTIVDSNGLCDGYDKCGSYKLSLNNVSFVAGGGTEQRNFDDNYTISFPLEVTETDSPTATPTSSTTVEPTCPPNKSTTTPTVAGCADVPPFDCVWLLNKEISDFNSYCSKMLPFVDEPVLKECGQNFLNFANMCKKNQPTE